jgi:uncharacterized protein YndB with AHSA1/START domain
MPPFDTASASGTSGFDLDEATHTIRFTRTLAAPPEAVFAAWTDPERLARWWDPAGEPLLRCDIDLRVGGAFTFVGRGHPEMPFSGVYREIAPPARLFFDAMGSEGRVLLSAKEGGTAMTVEIVCANEEHLRQFTAMGVAEGTSVTLDNLVGYCASRPAEAAE